MIREWRDLDGARRVIGTPDAPRPSGAEPPATEDEIRDAALQFVRKVSGYRTQSAANSPAFDAAVDDVASAIRHLLDGLTPGPTSKTVIPLQRRRAAAKSDDDLT